MTFGQVIDQADKGRVLDILSDRYASFRNTSYKTGKDRGYFSSAFDRLKGTHPGATTMLLSVSRIEEGLEEGDSPYLVCGLEPDGNGDLTPWGISYLAWPEWLAMELTPGSLSAFSVDEIAAHCLWEMMVMEVFTGSR